MIINTLWVENTIESVFPVLCEFFNIHPILCIDREQDSLFPASTDYKHIICNTFKMLDSCLSYKIPISSNLYAFCRTDIVHILMHEFVHIYTKDWLYRNRRHYEKNKEYIEGYTERRTRQLLTQYYTQLNKELDLDLGYIRYYIINDAVYKKIMYSFLTYQRTKPFKESEIVAIQNYYAQFIPELVFKPKEPFKLDIDNSYVLNHI